MKIRFTNLVVISNLIAGLFGLPSAAFSNSSGSTDTFIKQSRKTALDILERAISNPKGPSFVYKSYFRDVRDALSEAAILAPDESHSCGDAMAAYVRFSDPYKIHLCDLTVFGFVLSSNQFAEILIHEASHSIGVRDECDATLIQYAAYCYGKGNPPLFNTKKLYPECDSYIDSIGLPRNCDRYQP